MGRATIISGGDEGKYRVRIKYDRRRADAEIAKLQAEIPDIQAAAADIVPEITQAENDLVYLHQVMSAKIHELGQTMPGTAEQSSAQSAVRGAKKDLDKQEMVLSGLRQEQRRLEFEIARRETRIRFLQTSIPEDRETDAWCADYTENLTGDVGTIEPGRIEPDRLPTIMPGGPDGESAAHDTSRDGALQAVNAGTVASAFYNYAMLPGAARWRPRYRAGVIKSISGGTCTVDLDSLLLTHQRLPAGPAETLTDVPIVYMDCNESAFETDDHVIVTFEDQDPSKPRVIGFVDNPRPCASDFFVITRRNGAKQDLLWLQKGSAPRTFLQDVSPTRSELGWMDGRLYTSIHDNVMMSATNGTTLDDGTNDNTSILRTQKIGAGAATTRLTFEDFRLEAFRPGVIVGSSAYVPVDYGRGGYVNRHSGLRRYDSGYDPWILVGEQDYGIEQTRGIGANEHGVILCGSAVDGDGYRARVLSLQMGVIWALDDSDYWGIVSVAASKNRFFVWRWSQRTVIEISPAGAVVATHSLPDEYWPGLGGVFAATDDEWLLHDEGSVWPPAIQLWKRNKKTGGFEHKKTIEYGYGTDFFVGVHFCKDGRWRPEP